MSLKQNVVILQLQNSARLQAKAISDLWNYVIALEKRVNELEIKETEL